MKQLLTAVKYFVVAMQLMHPVNIRFLFIYSVASKVKKIALLDSGVMSLLNTLMIICKKYFLVIQTKAVNFSSLKKSDTSGNNSIQKGFTLIEVLVTLFIVAVALIGIMLVQKTIIDGAIDNSQRSIGVFKSSELIDRMRTNTDGIGFYSAILSTLNPDSCLVASSQRGPDCSSACTANDIARRDAFDVFCGSGTKGGAVNQQFINLQRMSLTCAGACELGEAANLTIFWKVTGANPNSDGVPQNTDVEENSISLDVVL